MKLKESIPSNSVKIIELYNKIDSEVLDTSPEFQRKLVWKKQHKYAFIGTILLNYPFPEVYIASAEMDVESLKSREIVVDGKQRLTAIVEYIKGINDFQNQTKIMPFSDLSVDAKRDFLNYLVTVKDLKDMPMTEITEIFERINSTEYALNAIERTNARYGDSEFSVFCKQIVDAAYTPRSNDTDIILDPDLKTELNNFFVEYNVFNENDKLRMFDVQYIMLIISTFLEGTYYSRSTKVNEYLEKYNGTFPSYQEQLSLLLQAIRAINALKLTKHSYWFNKANLFTLIVELTKIDTTKINYPKLENQLLELETKVDLYFSDNEDKVEISDDEKKYFEVARQGSHEKPARIHRGKVINALLYACLNDEHPNNVISMEQHGVALLIQKAIKFATIEPTKTGLEKSIMDATHSVREFLKDNGIHDYSKQGYGSEHRRQISAKYIHENEGKDLHISLYRANKRGDERIWFSDLKSEAEPNDLLALIYENSNIYVVNLKRYDIESLMKKSYWISLFF